MKEVVDKQKTIPTYTALAKEFWQTRTASKKDGTRKAEIAHGAFILYYQSLLIDITEKMSEIRPGWQPDSIGKRINEEELQLLWEEAAQQLDNLGDSN